MASAAVAAGGNLRSLKAVLAVLEERDIHVVKSTIWLWRRTLPKKQRPPIETQMTKTGRRMLVATRKQILEWVDMMEPKGLFLRPRMHHLTRRERIERLARMEARRAGKA